VCAFLLYSNPLWNATAKRKICAARASFSPAPRVRRLDVTPNPRLKNVDLCRMVAHAVIS